MNCENITIANASADDLPDILDLLSQVEFPRHHQANLIALITRLAH